MRKTTRVELERCRILRRTGVLVLLLLIVMGSACKSDRAKRATRLAEKRRRSLSSLPYLASRPASRASLKKRGVVLHDRERAHGGYNLYCPLHSDQVRLINMKGELVHTWSLVSPATRRPQPVCAYPELASDGSLYVIRATEDPLPMFKLDWRSRLLWATELEVHHDVAPGRSEPGTHGMHALGWEAISVRHRGHRFDFDGDSLIELRPDGEAVRKRSLYRVLITMPRMRRRIARTIDLLLGKTLLTFVHIKNGLARPQIERRIQRWIRRALRGGKTPGERLEQLLRKHAVEMATLARWHRKDSGMADLRDLLHANTLEILDAHPGGLWKAGDLLVCMKSLDVIAVIDGSERRVLWAWGFDELQGPHHPSQCRGGNLLVFDNGIRSGRSRLLEVDPITRRIVWRFQGDPPTSFFSSEMGGAQQLPNGNVLVTESEKGRAFEITRDGDVVWDFFVPDVDRRKGERGTVYRLTRLEAGVVDRLLAR